LSEFLPKLESLILTNNRLANLNDLDPLATLTTLKYLSLMDNPVTKKQNYRLYVIHLLPTMRVLDFRKVKQKEKLESVQAFGQAKKQQQPKSTAPKQHVEPKSHKSFTPGEASAQPAPLALPQFKPAQHTPEQAQKIRDAISKATTLDEVQRIKRSLAAGQLPDMRPQANQNNTRTDSIVEEDDPDQMDVEGSK
jgi:U2 small nuclear ribonucleoprotein A'